MQFFLRFLLSLCILFAGGYKHLHAHAPEQAKIEGSFDRIALQMAGAIPDGHSSNVSYTPYHPASENNQLYATETEPDSDKWTYYKKHTEAGNYFTAFFNARSTGYFQYYSHPLPFCKHFSHTAAHNCAVLQVFRN